VRLNCQFDLMESGQSPDGLGRDSHHRRRSCRSLRSLYSSAVSAIVGRGSQDLEGHPAPPMSRRLSCQMPTGKIRVLVFWFLYLSHFRAQQVGKLRVSLVPTSSHFQQPRCLCKLRFTHSVFEAHPRSPSSKPILTSFFTARHLLIGLAFETTPVKTIFEVVSSI
jgi:hypothetical protein